MNISEIDPWPMQIGKRQTKSVKFPSNHYPTLRKIISKKKTCLVCSKKTHGHSDVQSPQNVNAQSHLHLPHGAQYLELDSSQMRSRPWHGSPGGRMEVS